MAYPESAAGAVVSKYFEQLAPRKYQTQNLKHFFFKKCLIKVYFRIIEKLFSKIQFLVLKDIYNYFFPHRSIYILDIQFTLINKKINKCNYLFKFKS